MELTVVDKSICLYVYLHPRYISMSWLSVVGESGKADNMCLVCFQVLWEIL